MTASRYLWHPQLPVAVDAFKQLGVHRTMVIFLKTRPHASIVHLGYILSSGFSGHVHEPGMGLGTDGCACMEAVL